MNLRWLKRIFERQPKPKSVTPDRSKIAHSHVLIQQDGRTEVFFSGSVACAKGCKPVDGDKHFTTVEFK